MNHRSFLQNLKSIKKPVTELDWQNRNLKEGLARTAGAEGIAGGGFAAPMTGPMIRGAGRLAGAEGKRGPIDYGYPSYHDPTIVPGSPEFEKLPEKYQIDAYRLYKDRYTDLAQDIGDVASGVGAWTTALTRGAYGKTPLLAGIATSDTAEAFKLAREGKYVDAAERGVGTAAALSHLLTKRGIPYGLGTGIFSRSVSQGAGEALGDIVKNAAIYDEQFKNKEWKKLLNPLSADSALTNALVVTTGAGFGAAMKKAAMEEIAKRAASKRAAGWLSFIPAAAYAGKDVWNAVKSFKEGDVEGGLFDLGLAAGEATSGAIQAAGTAAAFKTGGVAPWLATAASTGVDVAVGAARAERIEQKRQFEKEQDVERIKAGKQPWFDNRGLMTPAHPEYETYKEEMHREKARLSGSKQTTTPQPQQATTINLTPEAQKRMQKLYPNKELPASQPTTM